MTTLKLIHILLALTSISGFVIRTSIMLLKPALLEQKLIRRLPHFIDTLLLVTGITLAWQFSYNPLLQPWLATKLILLLGYIVLGGLGLRYAPTRNARLICCIGALIIVMAMIYLAHYKPLLYGA